MEFTYQPMIENLDKKHWGQCEQEYIDEFNSSTKKFTTECNDAIKQLQPGQDLFTLDPEELSKYNGADASTEKLQFFERKFSEWLKRTEDVLNDESDSKKV